MQWRQSIWDYCRRSCQWFQTQHQGSQKGGDCQTRSEASAEYGSRNSNQMRVDVWNWGQARTSLERVYAVCLFLLADGSQTLVLGAISSKFLKLDSELIKCILNQHLQRQRVRPGWCYGQSRLGLLLRQCSVTRFLSMKAAWTGRVLESLFWIQYR